jgi:hypothetical protein
MDDLDEFILKKRAKLLNPISSPIAFLETIMFHYTPPPVIPGFYATFADQTPQHAVPTQNVNMRLFGANDKTKREELGALHKRDIWFLDKTQTREENAEQTSYNNRERVLLDRRIRGPSTLTGASSSSSSNPTTTPPTVTHQPIRPRPPGANSAMKFKRIN